MCVYIYLYIYVDICRYISIHLYLYLNLNLNLSISISISTILTPKAASPGHLWSYQTQYMCRRLANTHHTSCRTQTTPHTSERGSGISSTRPTPARSISLTTGHFLLLVKCGRRVVCRLGSGTHRPLHTHLSVWQWHQLHATDACAQHQPRDAPPPCSDRDERPPRRLRARQRAARPTLACSISLTTHHLLLLVKCGGRRRVVCSRGISCTQPTLACCLIAPRRLLRLREKSGHSHCTNRMCFAPMPAR